jgi:hypothetical protein
MRVRRVAMRGGTVLHAGSCVLTFLLSSAKCSSIAGDWVNNKAEGRGKYIYVNGNRYEGQEYMQLSGD